MARIEARIATHNAIDRASVRYRVIGDRGCIDA